MAENNQSEVVYEFEKPVSNPSEMAAKERERIATRHWEKQERHAENAFEEAQKYFDETHPDLRAEPHLMQRVLRKYNARVHDAAQKRQVVDWGVELGKIGNEVRREVGLPESDERERLESLRMMREARGQKVA